MATITAYYAKVKVMAKPFKIEIKGLDKLQKKIDKLPRDLTEETSGYLETICQKIQAKAISKAPKDSGDLKKSIDWVGAKLSYRIFASMHYAPYVEFGTGTSLGVPARLTEYASQFKGGNKRQQFRAATPYFFPAVFRAEAELKGEYSKLLDKVLSK